MIKNTVTVLVSVLVVLLSVEAVLRIWFPLYLTGDANTYRYDLKTGITLKSGLNFHKTTDYLQEIITNRLGTTNFQQSFGQYGKLVFAVGDSYTEGSGLPADASYPFRLDMMLNLKDGQYRPRYGVVNLGVASFGGEQYLIRLKRYIKRIGRPDYILYLGCGNDAHDDQLFNNGYRFRHFVQGSPVWGIWEPMLRWLSHDTEIGKRCALLVSRLRRRSIFHSGPATRRHAGGRSGISVAQREEKVLDALLRIARENHARLIVGWSGLPSRWDASYPWLKKWASEKGVGFADWHPELQSVRQAIPLLGVMNPHSGGHYRGWVQNLIARAFAREIRNG